VATIALLEYFALINFPNFEIVELAPFIFLVIFNECEVVTAISPTIMHTDCV
jgi:hypothetical protein